MSIKESLNDDKIYCKSIAKSISDIIRFSLNEEFRKKSFQMFDVPSTTETEREIRKRLIYMVKVENTDFPTKEVTSQNESENFSSQQDMENMGKQSHSPHDSETKLTPSTSTDSNFQAAPENIFKRNWLQISSQQYREIIKRKKLNYYSQPQFGQEQQYNFEFLRYSDSQPSLSGSSLSNEEKIQSLGDTTNYWKEKFKDDAEKYLNKNLVSHHFNPKLKRNISI